MSPNNEHGELYLGRTDNERLSWIISKLNTKAVVYVNRVAIIPILLTIVDRIRQECQKSNQISSIKFSNMDGRVTRYDLDLNHDDDDDDDSNTFEHSYKY